MSTRWRALALLCCLSGCSEGEEERPPPPEAPEPTATASATVTATAEAEPERPPPPDRWGDKERWEGTLEEQNAHMFDLLVYHHGIDAEQRKKLESIFAESKRIGQGNPAISRHPVTVAACRAKLGKDEVSYENESFEKICGGKYMAPLYDPDAQKPEEARACIDRFEFPNIPCAYPVTWAGADEAVAICQVLGKRLCDAHEWEGACWGKLEPPDYDFAVPRMYPGDVEKARKAMRRAHNFQVDETKRWAYGDEYKKGVCATASDKSKGCTSGGWKLCGTNTFPAGFFPGCESPLGVLDQHGNAAEHMNLPLSPEQMASAPDSKYGQTEMKGSWFVFDRIRAHEDHCRWRAPDWHGGPVMSKSSHRNYHLGFRCCKSL